MVAFLLTVQPLHLHATTHKTSPKIFSKNSHSPCHMVNKEKANKKLYFLALKLQGFPSIYQTNQQQKKVFFCLLERAQSKVCFKSFSFLLLFFHFFKKFFIFFQEKDKIIFIIFFQWFSTKNNSFFFLIKK